MFVSQIQGSSAAGNGPGLLLILIGSNWEREHRRRTTLWPPYAKAMVPRALKMLKTCSTAHSSITSVRAPQSCLKRCFI